MRLIFVNGCFDVLHRGHIELFKYARGLGDKLIVGIDTDERVRSLKGRKRPFNNQADRKYILQSIRYVDEVYLFKSDHELENLIKVHKPYIMVVGSDWKNKNVIGKRYASELRFFKRIENYSTSAILEDTSFR
tara:strand:+ start:715 stop:1113 length:399 start_codon:yes stop_codon:yes gene_type:complete